MGKGVPPEGGPMGHLVTHSNMMVKAQKVQLKPRSPIIITIGEWQ